MGLTANQRTFLRRFGFDEELFARWQNDLRTGRLSAAHNVARGEIRAPGPEDLRDLPLPDSKLRHQLEAQGRAAIARGEVGVVVLNGGMATRFGGVVKGIVEVLGQRSFLSLRVENLLRVQRECAGRIALFLMNSFATDAATRSHFAEHANFGLADEQVRHFTQFASARLTPAGDVFVGKDGDISPYSTGHGDFAAAMRASGCLRQFRAAGGRVLFVANVDNLGARVSPLLVGMHLAGGADATVEVAPKQEGDVGGSPYRYEGRLQLIEQIRYPAGFDPAIVDVFNTNSFHFSAAALERDFDLGWYYVEKKVDGAAAVQIERLIGEMTRSLDSQFVRVPRTGIDSRFLPVKTPEDLDDVRDAIVALYP